MAGFRQHCKLCDTIISEENFKVIVIKDIFDILLLKLKLDYESQNMICIKCSSKLLAAFKFKSTCLSTDYCIIPYVDFDNPTPVDLKEVYTNERGSKHGGGMLDDRMICRLCLEPISGDHKLIQEVPGDNIQIYIPEINFAMTTNPVICINCHDALFVHSTFLRNCLDVNKKIKMEAMDVKDILLTDTAIKTEEIEIKSEDNDDETLFGNPCKPEEEKNEEGDTSLYSQVESTCTEETESLYHLKDVNQTERSAQWAVTSYESKDRLYKVFEDFEENKNEGYINRKSKGQCSRKNKLKSVIKGVKVQEYQCHKCTYNTNCRPNSIRHQLIHKNLSEVGMYKCDECDYKTIHKSSLNKDPSELKIYRCDECDYKSIHKVNLKQHQLIHKDPSEVQMYECGECDYKTLWKCNLKQHQETHKEPSEARMFKCDNCDYKSVWKSSFKQHQLRHKDPSQVQMYKCDECNFMSKHKRSLVQHFLRHKDPSEVQMYECDECDYRSIEKSNLKRHQLIHKDSSEVQVFQCGECDFKNIRKKHLKRHQLRHKDPSEVQMYECDECEYKSAFKSDVKKHQLRHKDPSEVQMYECDECEYKSAFKCDVKRHQLRHKDRSEVQRYECDECEYKSAYKSDVKKHQLRWHKDSSEVQMLKCDECDYRSIPKDNLKQHMLKHTNQSNAKLKPRKGSVLDKKSLKATKK